eukprot:1160408-Pelagomonas_calceolata.AAC.1
MGDAISSFTATNHPDVCVCVCARLDGSCNACFEAYSAYTSARMISTLFSFTAHNHHLVPIMPYDDLHANGLRFQQMHTHTHLKGFSAAAHLHPPPPKGGLSSSTPTPTPTPTLSLSCVVVQHSSCSGCRRAGLNAAADAQGFPGRGVAAGEVAQGGRRVQAGAWLSPCQTLISHLLSAPSLV